MFYKYILFDLDGTLTDPKEGITNSVAYALNHYGIKVQNKQDLNCFIGPPLFASFEKYYGFSKEKAIQAVEVYREYFKDKGIFENKLYNGTAGLLKRLKEKGLKIALATSKPEVFAIRILEHFNIKEYFDVVVGSLLNGDRIEKSDVVAEALLQLGSPIKSECVMIGDRSHDIIGANKNGIDSIGVLYGYGNKAEFEEHNATYIVADFKGIEEIII